MKENKRLTIELGKQLQERARENDKDFREILESDFRPCGERFGERFPRLQDRAFALHFSKDYSKNPRFQNRKPSLIYI